MLGYTIFLIVLYLIVARIFRGYGTVKNYFLFLFILFWLMGWCFELQIFSRQVGNI